MLSALLFLAGTVLSGLGLRELLGVRRLLATGRRGSGTVVALREEEESHKESDGTLTTRPVFYPMIRFHDGRRTVEFEGPSTTEEGQYAPGSAIPILWEPSNPSGARVVGEIHQRWITFFGFAILAFGFALYLYWSQ